MAKKTKEEVETPKEEKVKLWDVVDMNGDLLNIYKDKKVAEEFAGKVESRKVMPSPKGRTREDVAEALYQKKKERLAKLENDQPVLDKF